MTSAKRPRHNNLERPAEVTQRGTKRICLPIEAPAYQALIMDTTAYRTWLDEAIAQYPAIFPAEITHGYKLNGWVPPSKKLPEVRMRRIALQIRDAAGQLQVYNIAPSFVMPYMMGYTADVEKPLFLYEKFGVPFWGLTYVFGHDDSYWERATLALGHYHLVGTTVQDPAALPTDLLADEHHTKLNGATAYIPTTVGNDCVLGVAVVTAADEQQLTAGYTTFKTEAQEIQTAYQPATVNTDGWTATQLAWQTLFPTVTLILCFLHSFIKIRACGKHLQELFPTLCDKVWDLYHAPDAATFRTRNTALAQWGTRHIPGPVGNAVAKLCAKVAAFVTAYEHPSARRTSNMLDRHMEPMARFLYCTRYFHGHLQTAEVRIRAWALAHNFLPYCPRATVAEHYISPAHKLNGFVYHENWLENLLIAASLGGCQLSHKKC